MLFHQRYIKTDPAEEKAQSRKILSSDLLQMLIGPKAEILININNNKHVICNSVFEWGKDLKFRSIYQKFRYYQSFSSVKS